MRFNFRKISAIATSALMIGMTAGVAAAANYPAPFIEGGAANVAVVMSTGEGYSALDHIESTNIFSDLQSKATGTTGTTGTVTGEAFALFTGSSKIYIGDAINAVKTIVTDTDLPLLLVDGDFEGDVSATYTQTVTLGSNPRFAYGKYPTSDSDPSLVFNFSTTAGTSYIYNATVTFNKAVNLTHSDSEGETLTLFGQKFTIGSATTGTDLVLFKSSQEVSLSVGGADPTSTEVTVEEKTYTVELTGATATTATVKVTDSNGASEVKEITEETSKKVQGLDISVKLAASSEATSTESATIMVGANRIELTDGSEIKVGSDEDSLDNTNADIVTGGNNWGNVTSFLIQVAAQDSDLDAIKAGESYVDPIFGSFKINFAGLNIAEDSTARENIVVKGSGNDKANVKFTNHKDKEATVEYYYNVSSAPILADNNGNDIRVIEMTPVNKSEYVVLGNEDEGYLLEVTSIKNDSSGFSNDEVKFKDAMSGAIHEASITSEGTGSVTIGGKTYAITYLFNSDMTSENRQIRMQYPDSTGADDAVIFPTIETGKGAKLAFYQPTTIAMKNWDNTASNLATLRFPDGNGYTDVAVAATSNETHAIWTIGGTNVTTGTATSNYVAKIGPLYYNINGSGTGNSSTVYLRSTDGTSILSPAIVLFEEQDDSASQVYNAIIVKINPTLGADGSSTNPVGVDDVEDTWSNDSLTNWNEIQGETNDDMYYSTDYYGTMQFLDKSDTDSHSVVISYPDEQIYPEVYLAEVSAAITTGTGPGGAATFNGVVVTDSEVASVSGKNLIIVGGSCVNSAAATLVGGAYCGSDWTQATGVGTGQYLIKGYATNSLTSKMALLVAGYEKEDTVNAAKFLRTQVVDTSKKYIGTTATVAEAQVETTA